MSFSGYQIRGDVLATMKEASGNFMPDYGNWRVRLKKAEQPEGDLEEGESGRNEQDTTGDADASAGIIPGTPDQYGERTVKEWVSQNLPGYRKAWESNMSGIQDMYDSYEDYVEDIEGQKKLAAAGEWEQLAELTGRSVDDMKQEFANRDLGGYWKYRTERYLISEGTDPVAYSTATATVDGETVTDSARSDEENTPMQMRSPMLARSPFYSAHEDNPYKDVDKMLADQATMLEVNGSIATKEMHDHVKKIAGDIKNNVFFKDAAGDKRQEKANQEEARSIMQAVSKSFNADLSAGGTIETFYNAYKDNLLSNSITDQEKFIFANLMQMTDVKPAIDENNHIVYPVKMPTGETFPVTSTWINDTISKRIKPYNIANQFTNSKKRFYDSGRAGNRWDKDAVIMTAKKMVETNPNQLASLLLDDNLFTAQPLIDHILDAQSPGLSKQVYKQELVFRALANEKTRAELENDFAMGLEKIAAKSWNAGKEKFDQENKSKQGKTSGMTLEQKIKYYTSNK